MKKIPIFVDLKMSGKHALFVTGVVYMVLSLVSQTQGDKSTGIQLETLSDHPEPLLSIVDEKRMFNFNVSISGNSGKSLEDIKIVASVDDSHLVKITNKHIMAVGFGNGREINVGSNSVIEDERISVVLEGILPGRTALTLQARSENFSSNIVSYTLFVERTNRVIDRAFTGVVILLVVLANIGMGCKVDLGIVKATLKKPIAPAIGLCSQFLFMPLIGFTMAYNLPLEPGVALGFFALGCSPGGSASNVYTNFLNGNISLSVTMTLISSIAALGFIPLWLFTLGELIYSKGNIRIPYENIITSLIGIVAPIFIGLVLQYKLPKAAKFCIKSVKYIMVIFFIFVFTVGVYANIYIFYLISPEVILASALLPYLGFIFGGIFAFLTRQKFADIIAISLETGIQNTGIPIILCRLSLSGPDKDTSIVSPVISAIFTPIPVMFAILFVQIKEWRRKRREARQSEIIDDTNCDVQNQDTAFNGTQVMLVKGEND